MIKKNALLTFFLISFFPKKCLVLYNPFSTTVDQVRLFYSLRLIDFKLYSLKFPLRKSSFSESLLFLHLCNS